MVPLNLLCNDSSSRTPNPSRIPPPTRYPSRFEASAPLESLPETVRRIRRMKASSERKQELYDQEVHNLPIDLHERDVNTSFWLAFPTDPAHKHMHEMDWDPAFRDSVIPQHLPPPGRFGHGKEISHSVGNLHARPEQRERDQSQHANLVFCDQGCGRSCWPRN